MAPKNRRLTIVKLKANRMPVNDTRTERGQVQCGEREDVRGQGFRQDSSKKYRKAETQSRVWVPGAGPLAPGVAERGIWGFVVGWRTPCRCPSASRWASIFQGAPVP